MRVASLEYFLTDTVLELGLEAGLVAADHRSANKEQLKGAALQVVTEHGAPLSNKGWESALCSNRIDATALAAAAPDVILTRIAVRPGEEEHTARERCQDELRSFLGSDVRVHSFNPRRLEDIFTMIEGVGSSLGKKGIGHDLAQRWKSQMLDWVDNFYERMRHKRVALLAGVEPYAFGGLWIPDMIKLCSAVSPLAPGDEYRRVEWSDVVAFQPDVVLVAPRGKSLKESMRTFLTLEQLPDWERLPAVKRGEVFFTDGAAYFHEPTAAIRDAMAILISAIAGLESGYISKRDSFYRMRWLELRRHELR